MPKRKVTDYIKIGFRRYMSPSGSITITEFLDPRTISRVLEPQSGNHIKGQCLYVVSTTQEERSKVLTMEEVYDQYPWFFK